MSDNNARVPVSAAILIGGRSRRMGTPKQLLRIDGETLLARVVRLVRGSVADVALIGDGPIPEELNSLARLSDAPGVSGPVAGIAATLRSAPDRAWLILPCDLPRFDARALNWLCAQRGPSALAIIPVLDRVTQPLPAIFEPGALESVEAALRRGETRARRLIEDRCACRPIIPTELAYAWTRANTPDEWARALESA